MSFDVIVIADIIRILGLNPFRTGQCLSTERVMFDEPLVGLNPFRTGQCLSTRMRMTNEEICDVLIPFVQGNVFRLWKAKLVLFFNKL